MSFLTHGFIISGNMGFFWILIYYHHLPTTSPCSSWQLIGTNGLIHSYLNGERKIKENNAESLNTSKISGRNICGIFLMYEEGLFVSYIHNYCTFCHIQFHDLKSLNHSFFLQTKVKIIKV